MDESWRKRLGTPSTTTTTNLPPRRSTEDKHHQSSTLDPVNFDDVFGGPPRSILTRQYSLDDHYTKNITLEDIVFRKPKVCMERNDRMLPEFKIPASGRRRSDHEEFYSDIFGDSSNSSRLSRSRSKSKTSLKSNSSSILSSEDLSPFRHAGVDDDDVSFASFASKLRPINVASKWNTSQKMHEVHETANKQPDSPCNSQSFERDYINLKGSYPGFSQRVSSPGMTSYEPHSYASVRESVEDLQVNSPASIVSSLNQDQEDEVTSFHEEDDEVMSSYVIEINPTNRERISEGHGVDEAIAWAKCQTRTLEKEWNNREDEEHECPGVEGDGTEVPGVHKVPEVPIAIHGSRKAPLLDKRKEWITEEPLLELEIDESPRVQMELELLDEDIKLWSEGKEANVRLLLSTLHHILWPSSGWIMIPYANLKESSNVKKAYQKARLCLHPDKLQQRGATTPQKYVAEKAFPILQDAWAAFISQDVRSSLT